MSDQFTPRENDLYAVLVEAGANVDVPIVDLYDSVFTMKTDDFKLKQMRLGAIISRVNNKLDGVRIKPGELKRTYRLVVTVN